MVSFRDKLQAIREGKAEQPPIARTLGMKVVHFGNGKALATMHVDKRFHNPMGTLHGGIMTDLADLSMGAAIASTLENEESFTTLELKMNFLLPVHEGELIAESRVLHKGRTIALTESVLKIDKGKEVARGIATQMILRPQS